MSLQEFVASLDDAGPRDEVYNTYALARLAGADRQAAEDLLIQRAQDGDRRAALTLGVAGVTRALPTLEALAANTLDGSSTARRAVLLLRPDDAAAQAVAGDLDSPSMYERIAAVEALAKHGGPVARRGLDRALDDTDSGVRRLASERFVEVLGLHALRHSTSEPDETEPAAPLESLCWLMSSDVPSLHRYGAAELRRVAAAIDAGQTPASLDLVYRPGPDPDWRDDFSAALSDDKAPIPIDKIRSFSEHERRFAEFVLALRLDPSVRDPRSPGALMALGADWARPAIIESAEGLPPSHPFAAAVAAAVTAN